jgi:tyrosine decarboxylase/aspartate 1-decarboxylase
MDDILKKAESENFTYDKILSSMCTIPHPVAVRAHLRFIHSNLGDPALFPGTKKLEDETVSMIGSLFHLKRAYGYLTSGGTESNIQAVRAYRNLLSVEKPNIVVPQSAHFSFDKISDLLKIEVRKARLNREYQVDSDSVRSLLDENTVCIVGIAGTTEFGQIDPIEELSEIAEENKIPLHVDAAFGGLIIPFLSGSPKFDFQLSGVTSVSVDPHKMGMSTIPSGCLIFRRKKYLDALKIPTPYLVSKEQYSLSGTRPGASAAATYAVLSHLGWKGLKKIVERCIRLTQFLLEKTSEVGIFPVVEPRMNVVALKVPKPKKVAERLSDRGWKISITRKPVSLRLVIMPHVKRENLQIFISDLSDVVRDIRSGD